MLKSLFKLAGRTNTNIPSKEWWDWATAHETDDINKLTRRNTHKVFLCDSLMKGHKNHNIIGDLPHLPAFTHQNFNMWKKRDNNLVLPLEERFISENQSENRIRGELYFIPTELVVYLDKLYEKGIQFKRLRTNLEIPWRPSNWHRGDCIRPIQKYSSDTPKQCQAWETGASWLEKPAYTRITAWMYVGNQEYWADIICGTGRSTILKSYPSETKSIITENGTAYDEIPVMQPNHNLKPYYFYPPCQT
jgi:gamma-glutamylcyclotransferase (GGCT)/AIG2-like uncharacterized protein YtfP